MAANKPGAPRAPKRSRVVQAPPQPTTNTVAADLAKCTAGHKQAMITRTEQIEKEAAGEKTHLRGPCVHINQVQEKSKRAAGHDMGVCVCGGIIKDTCAFGRKLTDCGTYEPK